MNFHRNPEEVRAEKEAKRQQQNFYRNIKTQQRRGKEGEDTEKQRRKKEQNKSYHGNHNRKHMSANKMSKGMR